MYSIASVAGTKDSNCLFLIDGVEGGVGGHKYLVAEDGRGSKLTQGRVGVVGKGCKVVRVNSGEVLQQDHFLDVLVP